MRIAGNPEPNKEITRLEDKSSTLGLLVTTVERNVVSMGIFGGGRYDDNIPQLEVLASLQRQLLLGLALRALKTQDDLLGSLGLLVEDRLGLTTITALLSVVTTLTLGSERGLYLWKHFARQHHIPSFLFAWSRVYRVVCIYLASLVLGDLVLGVLVAVLGLAVRPAGFGNVDLVRAKKK